MDLHKPQKWRQCCWDSSPLSENTPDWLLERTCCSLVQPFLQSLSSVAQSCLTFCDPMDCSMPGLPVHHQLPEQVRSTELVMPSNHLILCRPLLLLPSIFPSIRVFSSELVLCIRWSSIRALALASVLPMNIQGSFPLGLISLICLLSKGLSRVFSSTTVQKDQFFSAQLSSQSNSHGTDYFHIWDFIKMSS